MADNFLSQLDALDANIPPKNQSSANNAQDDFISNLDALDANIPAKAQNKSSQADIRKFEKEKRNNPKLNRFEQGVLGIVQGVTGGVKDIANTALNYLPTGFISTISRTSPEVVEASRIDFKNALGRQEAEYQDMTPDTGFVPRAIGSLADPIGATAVKLFPKATGIAKVGSNVLGRAIPNATLGALATPEEDTLSNRAKNAGLGIILGEGISAGGTGVRYLTGKAIGKVAPKNKEIQEALSKEGIRATAGDIGDNSLLKKAEVLNENVPFGMSEYRQKQQNDINLSAEKRYKALQDDLLLSKHDNLDNIKNAVNNPKRGKEAQALLNAIEQAGDDPNKILQNSVQIQSLNAKIKADEAYNKVESAIDKLGNPTIKSSSTTKILKEIANNDDLLKDKSIQSDVNQILENINKKQKSSIVNEQGKAFSENISPTYQQLRNLRTKLNGIIGRPDLINTNELNAYRRVLTGVENDLDKFHTLNPNIKTLASKANTLYKNEVIPFRDNTDFQKIVNNANPDTIFQDVIKPNSQDRLANIVSKLDSRGKIAIKYGLFQDALDKATNQTTGDKSPAKIAGYIEKYRKPINALGEDTSKEFRGYAKILRHVQRAGQFTEDPPTGNRAIGAGLLGGTLGSGNILLTAKILSSSQVLKFLTTTKVGKALLLRASNLEQDSPALDAVLQKLTEALSKVAIRQQTIPKADEANKDDELTPIDDELQPIED